MTHNQWSASRSKKAMRYIHDVTASNTVGKKQENNSVNYCALAPKSAK